MIRTPSPYQPGDRLIVDDAPYWTQWDGTRTTFLADAFAGATVIVQDEEVRLPGHVLVRREGGTGRDRVYLDPACVRPAVGAGA